MNLTIPIFIKTENGPRKGYCIHPLFALPPEVDEQPRQIEDQRDSAHVVFDGTIVTHGSLESAEMRMTELLRKQARSLVVQRRHDQLSALLYNPSVSGRIHEIPIHDKRRSLKPRLFVVELPREDGGKLLFTPSYPLFWFSAAKGDDVKARVSDVMSRFFKQALQINPNFEPESLEPNGKAWLGSVQFQLNLKTTRTRPADLTQMLLGGAQAMNGDRELQKVGDPIKSEDGAHVYCRDQEIQNLRRLLLDRDRTPILLVGPPGVGKTALIKGAWHGVRETKGAGKKELWHLSPNRLISGMSYVGQWESRVNAILKYMACRGLLLFLDDLLGLFQAGRSASSDLSIGQVIKPWLQKQRIQVVAEITPTALARLREQDRGFVDLFQIIHVTPPDPHALLKIVIRTRQLLEAEHGCQFSVEVLSLLLNLAGRFRPDQAMPGRAVEILSFVASRQRGQDVDYRKFLESFSTLTGMRTDVLDDKTIVRRDQVLHALQQQVIGQEAAVAACADRIALVRARLQDPARPSACFLFLGPTGVGKTQTAKALARYLFNDDSHLLRFDMNEYTNYGAVDRLVGTLHRPEGQLTRAVRQQPFAVVLFDEIEKAHASVFDLLLQVLGEGRLSDALGRTADFTNTMIVMTSNLGVRESASGMGLTQRDQKGLASVFRKAAEDFFRPELFNRIDRVVPFMPLAAEHVRHIADLLIRDLLQREGLRRRRIMLDVAPELLDYVAGLGYQPELGARALKRAVEAKIAAPLARALAPQPPTLPVTVKLLLKDGAPHVVSRAVRPVQQRFFKAEDNEDPAAKLAQLYERHAQLAQAVATLEPEGEEWSVTDLDPRVAQYFQLRDRLEAARQGLQDLDETVKRLKDPQSLKHVQPAHPTPDTFVQCSGPLPVEEILEQRNLARPMAKLIHEAGVSTDAEQARLRLRFSAMGRRLAMIAALLREGESTVLIRITPNRRAWGTMAQYLRALVLPLFEDWSDYSVKHWGILRKDLIRQVEAGALVFSISGPAALALTSSLQGLHYFLPGVTDPSDDGEPLADSDLMLLECLPWDATNQDITLDQALAVPAADEEGHEVVMMHGATDCRLHLAHGWYGVKPSIEEQRRNLLNMLAQREGYPC